MADRAEIAKKVIEIIAKKMDKSPDEITEQMTFINDLGADSLDTVEIMMDIEDEFGLSIPEEEAQKIETIALAIDYVASHSEQ